MDLEKAIEFIEQAETTEEAFSRFSQVLAKEGYTRVAYSLITDHPSLKLPKQHGLATSYPEDWMKHYQENEYLEDDAVVVQMNKSRKPFFWNDLEKTPDMSQKSLNILRQGGDAGVKDGIGIPLFGALGEMVGVGIARETGEKTGRNDFDFMCKAYFLSVFFHETFRSHLLKPVNIKLTNREREILLWAAEGKTDDVISSICRISINTVRFHWKNIFKKLNVCNRIYAVTKAIRMELIIPEVIKAPYINR